MKGGRLVYYHIYAISGDKIKPKHRLKGQIYNF